MRSFQFRDDCDEQQLRIVFITRAHRSVIEALAAQDDDLDARRRQIVRATQEYQRLILNDVDQDDAFTTAAAAVQRTRRPWSSARRLRKIQRERDALSRRAWAIFNRSTRDDEASNHQTVRFEPPDPRITAPVETCAEARWVPASVRVDVVGRNR